jgi:hypothetical protein
MMRVNAAGVEYVHVPVAGVPADAGQLQASFDGGPWQDMEWEDGAHARARILVRGPDSDSTDGQLLAVGEHKLAVQLADNPEVVIRASGTVTIG